MRLYQRLSIHLADQLRQPVTLSVLVMSIPSALLGGLIAWQMIQFGRLNSLLVCGLLIAGLLAGLFLLGWSSSLKGSLVAVNLSKSMGSGTRPRDLDPNLIEQLLACRNRSIIESAMNLHAYYWARDMEKLDEAGQYLDLALAKYVSYPIASRDSLFLEGAYFEARYRGNVAAAFGWLADSNEGNAELQTRCRAESALLWARGRFAEAASRAENGLKAIPNSRDLGGRIAEQAWLEDLLRVSREGMANSPEAIA